MHLIEFFPGLILSWQRLREFEPRADLFGSAAVKKRNSARDVLSLRSFSKGCPDTDPPLLLSSIRRHICSRRYRQPRPGLGPSSNEAIRTFHLHSRKLFIHHLFFWLNNKRTLEPDWGANAEAEARSERAAAVLYIFFLRFSGYQQARVARRRAEERRRPSHRSHGGLAAAGRAHTHVVLFASCGTKDYFNKTRDHITVRPSLEKPQKLHLTQTTQKSKMTR